MVLSVNPNLTAEEREYYHTLTSSMATIFHALSKYGLDRGDVIEVLAPMNEHVNWYNFKKTPEDFRPLDKGMLFSQIATHLDPVLLKHGLRDKAGISASIPLDILSKLPSNPLMKNPKNLFPTEQRTPSTARKAPGFETPEIKEDVEEQTKERGERWMGYLKHQPTEPTPGKAGNVIKNILKKGEAVTEDIQNVPLKNPEDFTDMAEKQKAKSIKNQQLAEQAENISKDLEDLDTIL